MFLDRLRDLLRDGLNSRRRKLRRQASRRQASRRHFLYAVPLQMEPLEERCVLATFVVSNTNDSGAGSLRAAILAANVAADNDTITFSIGTGVQTIAPLTALPSIDQSVTIDGTAQPGYAGTPLIQLDGVNIGVATNGLYVNTNNSLIKGVAIVKWSFAGIIFNGNNNKLQSSYIGVHPDGTTAGGNASGGVWVYIGNNNVVGTDGDGVNDAVEGNVISGNISTGVYLQDSSNGNVIAGNIIGLNAPGTAVPGTQQYGVWMFNDAVDATRIGTDGNGTSDALERNVLSGNTNNGIRIDGADNSIIAGNLIGTNVAGTAVIAGGQNGVSLGDGTQLTRIGTDANGTADSLERNVIVGGRANVTGASYGIVVSGSGATGNTIAGNYVGMAPDGTTAMPNDTGILVELGAASNTIGGFTDTPGAGAGNVVAGNTASDITLRGAANNTIIRGNLLGLGADGATDLGNAVGISMSSTTVNPLTPVLIGGDDAADGSTDGNVRARNVISGYTAAGINMSMSGSVTNTTIQGNYIGTNRTGTAQVANGTGILVGNSPGTLVGGSTAGAGNVISGNTIGVYITSTNGNSAVLGNFIGLNAAGDAALGNTIGVRIENAGNTIGGTTAAARNIISGNSGSGVEITGIGATGNTVSGNYIGTNAAGTEPLAGQVGWYKGESNSNDSTTNGLPSDYSTTAVTFDVGKVGLGFKLDGTGPVSTTRTVSYTTGASFDLWFQTSSASGTLATDGGLGTDRGMGLFVEGGNLVLRGSDGTASPIFVITGPVVDNGQFHHVAATWTGDTTVNGVRLYLDGTLVGQATAASAFAAGSNAFAMGGHNTLSYTLFTGILDEVGVLNRPLLAVEVARINNAGSQGKALGNRADGVKIDAGATGNTIGGNTAAARNVISGNAKYGVQIAGATTSGNVVASNFIGTDATGTAVVGNDSWGVFSEGSDNTIGGLTNDGLGNPVPGTVPGNVISGNPYNVILYGNGDVVAGNLIGTDLTGTVGLWGNRQGGGVFISGVNNTVGGLSAQARNVISGNSAGVSLGGVGVAGNAYLNNYIGTDITGTVGLGNGGYGVYFHNTGANNTFGLPGAGNVVAASASYGMLIQLSPNLTIQGNKIGTNAAGTAALPNGSGLVLASVDGLQLGGTAAGAGNVISGNTGFGANISSATGGTIQGNFIGMNAAGTAAIPNANGNGLDLIDGVNGFLVGGTTAAARNIIGGNRYYGLQISGLGNENNVVQGNYFGVGSNGNTPIPNVFSNLVVASSARNNTIGGTAPGAGNVISGSSSGSGVIIDGSTLPAYTYAYFKADGNTDNTANTVVGAATISGGVTYGPGKTGQAWQFSNAAGDRVTATNDPFNYLLATAGVTQSAWINLSSLPGATPYVIVSRAYSASSENYGLYVNSGGELVFKWYSAGAFHTATSTGAALGTRIGQFQHIAVVVGESTITFYVNGAAVSSSPKTDPFDYTTPGNVEIGGLANDSNTRFDGLIDEVAIQTNVLRAEDIARIFANGGRGILLGGGGTQGTVLQGNIIGLNATGTAAVPNALQGVEIVNALNNTIGGGAAGAGNLISGNFGSGVLVKGSAATGNTITGNYIGTNVAGTAAIANNIGVEIRFSATGNRVGGSTAGERNIISGNVIGVSLVDSGTAENRVSGNYIGTDWTGTGALGNSSWGVLLYAGASDNIIGNNGDGTSDSTEGNVISGNSTGIHVQTEADNNVIAGNFIGTNATGSAAIGNVVQGIRIFDNTVDDTRIGTNGDGVSDVAERNVISANGSIGIFDGGGVGTIVAGNYVGTDATGSSALGGQSNGIVLFGTNARIGTNADGTNDAAERNVVSGHGQIGVELSSATGTTVAGNYIGTNAAGTLAIANVTGVLIENGANGNSIGGSTAAARNVISGNAADGVLINGAGSTNNTIAGNYIGVDVTGNTKLANVGYGVMINTSGVTSNMIGGLTGTVGNPAPGTGPGNVISGNSGYQIFLAASGQTVQGNLIGLGADGSTVIDVANVGIGDGSVSNSLIGGMDVRARNVISGLAVSLNFGSGTGTRILNNYIGTDVTGSQGRGSGPSYLYGPTNLTIGAAGAGNVWSASSSYPVQGFGSNWTIQGNRFGTTADGSTPLLNSYFWNLYSLTNFVLGGAGAGEGNQIADQINLADSTGGTVEGNTFGLNAAGTAVLAGSTAELSLHRSAGFTIGGSTASARNVFASGGVSGIDINGFGADGNVIRGNYFGTNAAGTGTLGTFQSSIYVSGSAANNTIDGNVIAKGSTAGVFIDGGSGSRINDIPNFAAAWFKADGDLTNRAGYSQSGAFVGPVAYGPGVAGGQAFLFNRATPGYVKSEHIASYTLSANNVSVEGWINPANLPAAGEEFFIASNGDTASPNYAALMTNTGGSTRLAFRYLTTAGLQTATTAAVAIGPGSFHHVAVTADATNVKFYVDGLLFDTIAIVGAPTTVNNFVAGAPSVTLYVGGGTGATNRTFDGKIDELTVYNRALTAAEIGRIFSIGGVDKGGNWTRNTTVTGNLIGLLADGITSGAIIGDGIKIDNSESNTIGGTTASDRNIISKAGGDGVKLTSTYARFNVVASNYIGTDVAGTVALANGIGISIEGGASDNTIGGGSIVGAGNLISGNTSAGVTIQGASSRGNKVQGNRIGLNAFGFAPVANGSGVLVAGAGSNNIIGVDGDGVGDALEGNLISGNFGNGGGISISGSSGVTIAGNVVGLDATGTLALPNQDTGAGYSGVVVSGGNRIGTNSDGVSDELERNVIAGNIGYDLLVAGNNNTVAGNYVGLNAAGNAGIGLSSGLILWSSNNLVGTNADGVRDDLERNVVSAVRFNFNAANNTIAGNFIGTTANGLTRLASAGGVDLSGAGSGNVIGGPTTASRNIVASQTYGMDIRSSLNTIQNNYINVTPDGNSIIANSSVYSGVEVVTADNLLIGNTVAGFASGIRFLGAAATSNTASGNFIGTNSSGTSSLGNTYGVSIISGASNNTIGGSSAAERNVISGNIASAVFISGATTTGNVLLGNYIGLGADGSTSLGNEGFSVFVNGAPNNTIGGLAPGEGNVISATTNLVVSTGSGIQLYPGANNTRILGNRIGTDATGNLARPNRYGIVIPAGVSATEIRGNQISSNTVGGIDTQSPNSVIAGNFFGTNANGTNSLGSGQYGIAVNATNVRIGGILAADRNVISGHNEYGIAIQYTSTGVLVQGNYIGTDVTGTAAISNGSGVVIAAGAANNTIGGSTAGERNIISGNSAHGIAIADTGTNGNVIQGNYIGTNAAGTADLGNVAQGINITGGTGTIIGGNTATAGTGAGNVISGNGLVAISFGNVHVSGSTTTGTVIQGNIIGLNAAGTAAIDSTNSRYGVFLNNAPALIGGTAAGVGNILSGHAVYGVVIAGTASTGTLVQGNIIGLGLDGTTDLGNTHGVSLDGGATGVTVGGTTTSARNVISGNDAVGVLIHDPSTTNNIVSGNYIGTDTTGTLARGNVTGIFVETGVTNTRIGGTAVGAGNLVSGNSGAGIILRGPGSTGHTIVGNFIGTTASGADALANENGVVLIDSSSNTIGGTSAGARNVISGNTLAGISVGGAASTTNTISGNYIGTNAAGIAVLANGGDGVQVYNSPGNILGGTTPGAGNLISGNENGISVYYSNNTVIQGNLIGTDATGTVALGNRRYGIGNFSANVTIGGTAAGAGNVIANNEVGVEIVSADSTGNVVQGNSIGTDATGTIALTNRSHGIWIHANAANNVVGGVAAGESNLVAFNRGAGLRLDDAAAAASTIRRNIIRDNLGLGIDVGTLGVTNNDSPELDGFRNFPVVTSATVSGANVVIQGFSRPGAMIDFYRSAPTASGFGQGDLLLATLVEGSADDADASTTPFGPVSVNGHTVNADTNHFQFTIPFPAGLSIGSLLTAVSIGSTSEFAPSVVVGEQGSSLPPQVTLGADELLPQGGRLLRDGFFIDEDSTSWTAIVDYGDGSGVQPLALHVDRAFQLDHTYTGIAAFNVTVTIIDNSNAVGTASILATVINDPPVVTFNEFTLTSPRDEGELVTLTGKFTDSGAADIHTIDINWGDGSSVSTVSLAVGSRTFAAIHTYRDDSNLAGAPSALDVYKLQVTIHDNHGGDNATPLGLFLEEIRNVKPNNLNVSLTSSSIVENDGSFKLSGTFADPGVLDTHRVAVDWGDGSPKTVVNLAANVLAFNDIPHLYRDDPTTAPDQYTVTVEVSDDDEPLNPVVTTRTVTVNNVIPSAVALTVVPGSATIDENGEITLNGSFTDPGLADSHKVWINWGDGTIARPNLKVLDLAPGVSGFSNLTHRYLDDPLAGSQFTLTVRVADDDMSANFSTGTNGVDFVETTLLVTVNNMAPVVGSLSLSRNGLSLAAGSTIQEGGAVTLTGSYSDIGQRDRHTVSVAWGDGSMTNASVDSTHRTFTATYTYRDNGTGAGELAGITVTVADDDGGVANGSTSLIVQNVAPTVALLPGSLDSDATVQLVATVDDPGRADQFRYVWTATATGSGCSTVASLTDPSPTTYISQTSSAFSFLRQGGCAYSVQLTATDDDGSAATNGILLISGTAGSDLIVVTNSTTANSVDVSINGSAFVPLLIPAPGQVLVYGSGNDDTIDGTGTTIARLILDGGAGTDKLYGGSLDDVYILHIGNDTANDPTGSITPNVVGNDRYYLVPNSVLTVYDNGGANALDFSLADAFSMSGMGAGTGVTFDLDLANFSSSTLWQQDVAPYAGTVNTHYVSTAGKFTELVGSRFGDYLTGATNSTVLGGEGADHFTAKTLAAGAIFYGGADADVFTITDPLVDSVVFNGDDGADVFTNLGDDVGSIVFNGDDGADVFTNAADAIGIDLVTFNGDDGADVFTNFGDDIATITFQGGADADVFTNEASSLGVDEIIFTGDDGADIFTNFGDDIATITFNGGADADVFTNAADTIGIDEILFTGDDGADIFTNFGDDIATITFNGGADADVFTNAADTIGIDEILFTGDDGADIFTNFGDDIATITFNGGADADVFTNDASSLGVDEIIFNGDDGADVFTNFGDEIMTITFNGGADADVFTNDASSLGVDEIIFTGDDGADVFMNFGDEIVTITFNGGADADVFTNEASSLGVDEIIFTGDDGADVFTNFGDEIMTITFNGGADADVFANAAESLGVDEIVFNGDDGADVFSSFGDEIVTITFNGGADADIFTNAADSLGVEEIVFNGDDGADVFRNFGDEIVTITFNGGADADVFLNAGDEIATITFNGGADADIFLNLGDNIGTIDFGGDDGADVFQNDGLEIDVIDFSGDDGADIFINNGLDVETIVFTGGADNDVLANYGDGVVTIAVNGNGDDDVLINRGNARAGVAHTSLVFLGGVGDDAFQNNGLGFALVQFTGDDGADVFQNNAEGVADIVFNGDDGADVFENNGDLVETITFNGGADADVFVNDGLGVDEIVFNGDDGADVFVNTGDLVESIVFQGDDGADVFVNTGDLVVSIDFHGDLGNDSLTNAGAGIGQMTFVGGADADRLTNRVTGIRAGTITFEGEDGADLFTNAAAEIDLIVFNGDDGADVFVNSGIDVASILFNGDEGADVFQNLVEMETIVFTGGADADVLLNRGNRVSSITFHGGGSVARPLALGSDDGADVFVNTGIDVASIVFEGGADADSLTNNGANVGSIIFDGNDGNDRLQNNAAGVQQLTFTGSFGDDALQNNASAGTVVFHGDDGADVFLNNGGDIVSIDFSGDDGADSFINTGDDIVVIVFSGGADADLFRTQGRNLGTVTLDGGGGSDALLYNSLGRVGSQVIFLGGDDDDVLAWRGSADVVDFDGGAGRDTVMVQGSGQLHLNGASGDDLYQFSGNPAASVTIGETSGGSCDGSHDTLDFSAFTGGALHLDLRSTLSQPQSAAFTIALVDGLGVENVIGTSNGDTISGNACDNVIYGAGYREKQPGGPVAAAVATRGLTQWVLLDFDSHTNLDPLPTTALESGEHVFTTAEREAIRGRIEATYRGPNAMDVWFDVRVTVNPLDPGLPTSPSQYATIYFNRTPSFGRPGGESSEVDFRNVNLGGWAAVQVNGLLGGVVIPSSATDMIENRPEDRDEQVGSEKPPATSENFVALAAKIGAHELGHLLGLRHQDSFGPIGYGLHDPPGGGDYKPAFTGPSAAFETFDHIIGSPASIGSDRFNDVGQLFFGEREAVKLAYAVSSFSQSPTMEAGAHNAIVSAQSLNFVDLTVPNTLAKGLNLGMNFFVQAQTVAGEIKLDSGSGQSESDWYKLHGYRGEMLNIEVMSQALARLGGDTIDSVVRLYNSSGQLVPYYNSSTGAENDDLFEPTDSSLIDVLLPADGDYYIEVDTFRRATGDVLCLTTNPDSPLNNPALPPGLRMAFADACDDKDQGHYELFLYRFARANATDGMETLKGFGGHDILYDGGDHDYALSFELGTSGPINEGSSFARTIMLNDPGASSWSGSTVDYGDGTGLFPLAVSPGGTLAVSHSYADNGLYTISVRIVDDIGQQFSDTLPVAVNNVAPTATLTNNGPVNAGSTAVASFGGSQDPSSTDTTAGFRYSFATSSSGLAASYASAGTAAFASFPTVASGTLVIYGRVFDKDGGYTGYQTSVTVNANATGNSIIVLDSSLCGALTLSGNASIDIAGVVAVNSSCSANALAASGNASVRAASIRVVGGAMKTGNAAFSPTPIAHAAPTPDPLAGLPAPAPGVSRGAVNCAGNSTLTIQPGIYSKIAASGNCNLTLTAGVYEIAGGGFAVSGNASVRSSSPGILVYNAGSNFPAPGGTYGSINLSGNGLISLAPMSSGTYADTLFFQPGNNTSPLSLTGNSALAGMRGTIYAPTAQLTVSGNGEIKATMIVGTLRISGNSVSRLSTPTTELGNPAADAAGVAVSQGQLRQGVMWVAIDIESAMLTADVRARIDDAIAIINVSLGQHGASAIAVDGSFDSVADAHIELSATSACGGSADGVLGCADGNTITLLSGWNWYGGTDASSVPVESFDFQTLVTHELAHALGLEHSPFANSVMFATLAAGVARRQFAADDLEIFQEAEVQHDTAHALRAGKPEAASPLEAIAWKAVQEVWETTKDFGLSTVRYGRLDRESDGDREIFEARDRDLMYEFHRGIANSDPESSLSLDPPRWEQNAAADALDRDALFGSDLLDEELAMWAIDQPSSSCRAKAI